MWLQTICKVLFQHNKEASITKGENESLVRMNGREKAVSKSHMPPYTINVPLNNFNIHQHNKEGIYLIGYQHYNESHQSGVKDKAFMLVKDMSYYFLLHVY